MQVTGFTLERSGRRVVFDSANAHRWTSKDSHYIDVMLEGEEVAAMQRILQLDRQEVMRVVVRVSFELDGERHSADGFLTVLDERRALISLENAFGLRMPETRSYLSGPA